MSMYAVICIYCLFLGTWTERIDLFLVSAIFAAIDVWKVRRYAAQTFQIQLVKPEEHKEEKPYRPSTGDGSFFV